LSRQIGQQVRARPLPVIFWPIHLRHAVGSSAARYGEASVFLENIGASASGGTGPDLAELMRYAEVGRRLVGHPDMESALAVLTEIAVTEAPGAQHAGVTLGSNGRFTTLAPTSAVVNQVDQIQYDLGSGPCVDAAIDDNIYYAPDLRSDERWPDFGAQTADATGIVSMLSLRLYLEHDPKLIAALNMYSAEPDAFSDESIAVGLLLATHGALAVAGAAAREHAMNLEKALASSRNIGVAMGRLMNQHTIARDQAFGLLRMASQRTHRKLADVAAEVARTGVLPPLTFRVSR
jgi:hypothetical protein